MIVLVFHLALLQTEIIKTKTPQQRDFLLLNFQFNTCSLRFFGNDNSDSYFLAVESEKRQLGFLGCWFT
jgi:hypothetical protein